ncbi:MAG: hypothetical protein Ct9H90mP24_7540 [Methanobacteriota archaeon]|nr:MAG: hypothetical protein Ct9H90mP24_7540 [Euryarchaeota archaeon]
MMEILQLIPFFRFWEKHRRIAESRLSRVEEDRQMSEEEAKELFVELLGEFPSKRGQNWGL